MVYDPHVDIYSSVIIMNEVKTKTSFIKYIELMRP
jgi:hypothetical protein